MSLPENNFLPLSLRSDRGYIYFPDAVSLCLGTSLESSWENIRAECFKTSRREIYPVISAEPSFERRQPGLFGSIAWREKIILLMEAGQDNPRRYEFFEPQPMFEIRDAAISWVVDERLFPSVFHRWTTLAKNLYHHMEAEPGYRMLLQRIEIKKPEYAVKSEKIRLEFMTKDRLLKFSVWHAQEQVGEVIAAGRPAIKP